MMKTKKISAALKAMKKLVESFQTSNEEWNQYMNMSYSISRFSSPAAQMPPLLILY